MQRHYGGAAKIRSAPTRAGVSQVIQRHRRTHELRPSSTSRRSKLAPAPQSVRARAPFRPAAQPVLALPPGMRGRRLLRGDRDRRRAAVLQARLRAGCPVHAGVASDSGAGRPPVPVQRRCLASGVAAQGAAARRQARLFRHRGVTQRNDLASSIAWPKAGSPSRTSASPAPTRSRVSSIWLSLNLPTMRVTAISIPTMALSSSSM